VTRERSRSSALAPPGLGRWATDPNRLEYEKRVNRVVDHVERHLAEELSLAALSRVAAFSPFHFHRVFRAITGETLAGFVQRLRLERSAGVLLAAADRSVLDVALDHGFASAATFARAFRAHFGMSATAWRRGGAERWPERRRLHRKLGKHLRKPGNALRRRVFDTRPRRTKEGTMKIRVEEQPTRHVVYMRHVGPYGAHGIPELWQRLHQWMETRGLSVDATVRLGVAHDDPAVTPAEKCRYDACLVVPADFPVDRWVNPTDIPGGRYAVTEFTGTALEIEAAWHRVFSEWLPISGYQPDDRPCFELYRGDPAVDVKTRRFRCDLCLPVKAL
jgi:AraC family transcriptional regulator